MEQILNNVGSTPDWVYGDKGNNDIEEEEPKRLCSLSSSSSSFSSSSSSFSFLSSSSSNSSSSPSKSKLMFVKEVNQIPAKWWNELRKFREKMIEDIELNKISDAIVGATIAPTK